jgi:hypothetical protein
MLAAQLCLRELLLRTEVELLDEVVGVADSLLTACADEPLDIPFVSESPTPGPFEHKAIRLIPLTAAELVEEEYDLDQWPLILIQLHEQVPTEVIAVIYKYVDTSSIFVLCDADTIDLGRVLGKRADALLSFSAVDELMSAMLVVGAYETMKKDLVETVFLFGLTPTNEAPSFSAQTGVLSLLPYSMETQNP